MEEGSGNSAKIILNAGLLKVTARANEGGEPLRKAYVYVNEAKAQANGKHKNITAGNQRTQFTVPAGSYQVLVTSGKARITQEVEVSAGQRTDADVILGAGTLKVAVLAEAGGKPVKNAYIRVFEAEPNASGKRKQITGGNQRNVFTLPAGRYYVTGTVGKAVANKEIEVSAGRLTEENLVSSVAALKVTVVPTEGAKPLSRASLKISEAEKGLDGSRKSVASGSNRSTYKLAAGAYHVEARAGFARGGQDVTLNAGKLTELTINVNAGSLSVKSKSKIHVSVFEAEKDLEGKRQRITAFHNVRPVLMPAGKYVLIGKLKGKSAELEVEITAGRMSEVTLDP